MMEQTESWSNPTPEYLTYYPNEGRAPHRPPPVLPPSFTASPTHGPNIGAAASQPVFDDLDGDDGQPRRQSLAPHTSSLLPPPSPHTATADDHSQTLSTSASSVIALPPFSSTFYPAHQRPPTTAFPGYYPPTSQLDYPPRVSISGLSYTSDLGEYPGNSPIDVGPAELASARPSLHHYYSSPRMPSIPTSVGRSAYSSSSSIPQLAPTSPLHPHSSGPLTSAPVYPGSYPTTQRQWIHRHVSTPRMSLDTSMGGGRSSGEGSYSTSPATHRYPPASPLHTQHFPGASSSSSSYPSVQHSTTDLRLQIKQETMGMSDGEGLDGDFGRSGRGKRRSGTSGRGSLRSWSAGDEGARESEGGDQPWGMPQDEYRALSTKDKKQIRNRIGARKFRARKKDYVASLEAATKERDREILALRQRVKVQHDEINAYRRQLGLEPISDSPPQLPSSDSLGLGLSVMDDGEDGLDRDFDGDL